MEEKKRLNFFLCADDDFNFFSKLNQISESFKDKISIIGQFNCSNILKKISYYLGIEDENKWKIENEENQNIIILHISFEKSKKLLKDFTDIFIEEEIKNDDHPFFIFIPLENEIEKFNIKNLFLEVYENENSNDYEYILDSRNISVENIDTIFSRIETIYNYFNENDEEDMVNYNNDKYNKNATINIMVIGKRGTGKSTIINRLLGEKKAYAQKLARTSKEREYYHKNYPLKFIDSAGFEIGEKTEINNVDEFLKKNNLSSEEMHKKVHFIFYVFKYNDKFEENEIKVLKGLSSFKIDMFFFITFMPRHKEKSTRRDFEKILKTQFDKNTIQKINDNTFCLDLLDISFSETINKMLLSLNEKLKKYKDSNARIMKEINNFLSSTSESNNELCNNINEKEKLTLNEKESEKNIISDYSAKIINNGIKKVQSEVKDNIFFIESSNDRRRQKKELAIKVVNSFKTPGFWWSTLTIPFLNRYLSRKSKEKMIKQLSEIYDIAIKKKLEKLNFNERNNFWEAFIFTIGGFVAGIWNKDRVSRLGEKIIEELDAEYSKTNILDIYYDTAEKLNKNFEVLEKYPDNFHSEYWYDINIEES